MIRLLTTGGTFEKKYCPVTFKMVLEEGIVSEILTDARCKKFVRVERLFNKISYHFTDSDYKKIVNRCVDCREKRIVITHGTTNMAKTAKLISSKKLDKTIVLVGAMVPYTIHGSDAGFNLGFAIASARLLSSGVHVAMNGKILDGTKVRKNKETGMFEVAR